MDRDRRVPSRRLKGGSPYEGRDRRLESMVVRCIVTGTLSVPPDCCQIVPDRY
jgi:hypothetical protein